MRELGRTGLHVSPIGLGTVKLGRSVGVKYPERFTIPDDEAAGALLRGAREFGINLIDTAPAYGKSESRLGDLLCGWRDEWVIVTKAGEEFEDGVSRFDFSPEAIRRSVDRSLTRLNTDRIEIVLLHSDGETEPHFVQLGSFDALESLKAEGKIRAFGASTKTLEGAAIAIERSDVVMLTLNLEERAEESSIDVATTAGVGVLVKKVLQSGHLAQDPKNAEDSVAASLRFVFGHAGVSSVVVGTINPEHLAQNVAAAERAISSLPGNGV